MDAEHSAGRVAWQQPDQDEYDDHDQEEGRHDLRQPYHHVIQVHASSRLRLAMAAGPAAARAGSVRPARALLSTHFST
jgi:hypothetical protein